MSNATLIDRALVAQLLDAAERSPRRRLNHNFHTGPADNPHRFLNVMCRDTYVTPHRHRAPPKAESFLVLQGKIAMFLFDDEGRVIGRHDLAAGDPTLPFGIDLPPGVWHSIVVLSDHAVIYEVKPGPWDPATDKEMAPWAPGEGEPGAAEYARGLLAQAQTIARPVSP